MPLITFLVKLDTVDICMTLVAIFMFIRVRFCDKKQLIHSLFLTILDRLSGLEVRRRMYQYDCHKK